VRTESASGKSTVTDDVALVRQMLSGNERSFDDFFNRFFPGIYRFALMRLADNAEAAEAVAQATLTAAIFKLATYRGEAALFSWLCTFCRHEIHRHLTKLHRASFVVLNEDAAEVRAALDSLSAISSDDANGRRLDNARLVRVVLDYLPAKYSEILEWKYLDGLPVADIAQRLRVSTKAAESLLTRARVAFRDGFAAVCEGDVSVHLYGGSP